jgi:small GTP-binding protein
MSETTKRKNSICSTHSNQGGDYEEVNRSSSEIEVITKTYKFKITLIGDSSVGKTSIITRYLTNNFEEEVECTVSGVFKTKKIKIDQCTEVELEIWDTAGQEKYRSLTKNFLQNSKGIVIVFDLSKEKTFDNLESWFNDVKEVVSETQIVKILAGNKSDIKSVIPEEKIKKFAEDHNLQYLQVSAKEGFNIEWLFEILAQTCYKNLKEGKKQLEEEQGNLSGQFGNDSLLINKQKEETKEHKSGICC